MGLIRRLGFGPIKPLQEQITLFQPNQRIEYKIIKYRFSEEDIEKLLSLKLYEMDEKQFLKMRENLQTDDVDALINFISA